MNIVTEYPLWFIIFCLLAGLGYAYFLYRKRTPELKPILHYLLFAFRSIVVSLLCFFLLNPLIKSTSSLTEKPIIVIAADNSASVVKNKDSLFYKKEFPSQLRKLADELSDKYEVRFVKFAGEMSDDTALAFSGKETNIAAALSEIRNNYEGKNLGAVVLATDGLYNTGNNPQYESEKSAFPVYTIALGDTLLQKDALIKKVSHNQSAYIGNQFPVEVQVQATDLKGKDAVVSIMQGEKKVAEQKITYNSTNHSTVLNFLLTADKAGLQRYLAVVSVAEGEQNKSNNAASFVVDVIDKREKILIIAGAPHPDINALKQAIEGNQSYEVEIKMAEGFNTPLKPYSLVILHQLGAEKFLAKKLLDELRNVKPSLWQFSQGAFWAFPNVRLVAQGTRIVDAQPVMNTDFALFTMSNELKNYMKEFPAVICPLGIYKVSSGASVLVSQQIGQVKTENPILVFADENGQKTALFCGDGMWRWRLRDFADHEKTDLFDELIQKTVQYLSVRADKSFFRVYTRRVISENEAVEFDAEVFNPSYELITEPDVNMVITDENKKQFTYTFSKTTKGYHLNTGNFPPGNYTYKAQVKINNQLFEQKGEFTVKQLMAEYTGLPADHALLYNLSKKTGGQMFYPKQVGELSKRLLENENIKTLVHEQKQVNDLINLRVWFYVLLVFLSLEWFIRKYNGLS